MAVALTTKVPFGVKVGVGAAPKVMVWVAATVRVTVACADWLIQAPVPVPVLVMLAAVCAAIGVPLMTPERELRVKPFAVSVGLG